MPTYDYQCRECGFCQEISQKITESPLTKCPSCDKDSFQRLISGGNAIFRFKGSGFYLTDYCQKGAGEEKSSSCSCTGKHSCD